MNTIIRGEITNPPDSVYGIWFYPQYNRFCDEDGNILHDLQDLFDIWQLEEWKKTKDYGLLIDRNGNLCEAYYLDPDEDSRLCDHDCEHCTPKCSAYSLWRGWETEYVERRYL